MAPTSIRAKPVATAIATLISIDKLTIFPSIMAAPPDDPPFLNFSFFLIASNFGVLMDARTKS